MTYHFTVSPDFGPEHLAGWFVFNTWLQRALGEGIHLEVYPDFNSQRKAIQEGRIDLIYANPYDASMLVREKGFVPLVKPQGRADEAIIAVNAEREIAAVEDLQPNISVATTDDPDVHMMGMIMLEPANLDASNIRLQQCDTYVLVAKRLLKGESDVGIFLAEAFHDLSEIVKNRLRILVSSQIQVVSHALMLGPAMAAYRDRLLEVLLGMNSENKGVSVLAGLGITCWQAVDQEEMEFMIDLMDTLMV